jgi:hypothetical protein
LVHVGVHSCRDEQGAHELKLTKRFFFFRLRLRMAARSHTAGRREFVASTKPTKCSDGGERASSIRGLCFFNPCNLKLQRSLSGRRYFISVAIPQEQLGLIIVLLLKHDVKGHKVLAFPNSDEHWPCAHGIRLNRAALCIMA